MARRIVLSDARPLIALSLIDSLDLVHALLEAITVTDVVHAELSVGGDKPGQAAIARAVKRRRIRIIPDTWSDPDLSYLEEGEASTLRAALHQRSPCLVLIDERAGRAVAKELGLPHVGTVGLIVQAERRGLIPSARALFEQLLARDFRVSAGLIRAALEQVGES